MATAPSDSQQLDLSASDILSPQLWAKSAKRPALGLDAVCTKIAVDFQSITAATAVDCIRTNLDA
jgi:hypothetical protein